MTDVLTTLAAEKERLTKKRTELEAQVTDLQTAIASVDHELQAIDAYHAALNGKAVKTRGSKRDTILAIIRDSDGLTRKAIVEKLRAMGQSDAGVSNTLNLLKKAGKITVDAGRYAVAA